MLGARLPDVYFRRGVPLSLFLFLYQSAIALDSGAGAFVICRFMSLSSTLKKRKNLASIVFDFDSPLPRFHRKFYVTRNSSQTSATWFPKKNSIRLRSPKEISDNFQCPVEVKIGKIIRRQSF